MLDVALTTNKARDIFRELTGESMSNAEIAEFEDGGSGTDSLALVIWQRTDEPNTGRIARLIEAKAGCTY